MATFQELVDRFMRLTDRIPRDLGGPGPGTTPLSRSWDVFPPQTQGQLREDIEDASRIIDRLEREAREGPGPADAGAGGDGGRDRPDGGWPGGRDAAAGDAMDGGAGRDAGAELDGGSASQGEPPPNYEDATWGVHDERNQMSRMPRHGETPFDDGPWDPDTGYHRLEPIWGPEQRYEPDPNQDIPPEADRQQRDAGPRSLDGGVPDDAGAQGDTGPRGDAGARQDAGMRRDAGPPADASAPRDAGGGGRGDAGAGRGDAGSRPDSGPPGSLGDLEAKLESLDRRLEALGRKGDGRDPHDKREGGRGTMETSLPRSERPDVSGPGAGRGPGGVGDRQVPIEGRRSGQDRERDQRDSERLRMDTPKRGA